MNYFSQNITYLIDSKQISVNKLLEITNHNSPGLVSMWKSGERTPITNDVLAIANYLHLTVDDLINKNLKLKKEEVLKQSKFHYKDEETGLSVELIPPEGVDWDKISKEEREEYINQAMDFLYEAKRNMKKDK